MPTYTVPSPADCCCGTGTGGAVLTTCCDPITIPTTLFATMTWDWSPDPDYSTPVTLTYDSADQKWKGTTTCNGTSFELQMWCDGSPTPGNWYFDLVKTGVSYGVPILNIPGGFSLRSCSPFDGDTSIVNYYADDIPLCGGKTGTFPGGDYLTSLNIVVTE